MKQESPKTDLHKHDYLIFDKGISNSVKKEQLANHRPKQRPSFQPYTNINS